MKSVVLGIFHGAYAERVDGERVEAHPELHLHPLRWIEASARADPRVAAGYELTVRGFEQDAPRDGWLREVVPLAPAVVGLSVNVSNLEPTLDFCRRLRLALPAVRIVLGGPEAADPESLLEHHPVDVVVLGDGELAFTALLRAWLEPEPSLEGIGGIAFLREGAVHVTGGDPAALDLDSLPAPHTPEQLAGLSGLVAYATSRGCAHRCAFCRWQPAPRRRLPPERVERELGGLLANPAVRVIYLTDAELSLRSERSRRLLRFIRDHNVHQTRLLAFFDFLSADAEGLVLTREAGFQDPPSIGLQSATPGVLEQMGRRWFRLDRLEAVLPLLKEHYPEAGYDVIYGLPGETVQSFRDTLRWCLEHGLGHLRFRRLMVMPGTELWRDAERYGLVFDREVPHFSHAAASYSHAELMQMERLAQAFEVVLHVLDVEDYAYLRERSIDLLEVMERAPEEIPDWRDCFTLAYETCIQRVEDRVILPLLSMLRKRSRDEEQHAELLARLKARDDGDAPDDQDDRREEAAQVLAARLISPCQEGELFVEGWTLAEIRLEGADGGGITYVFEWEGHPCALKAVQRDDDQPRMDHSERLNLFQPAASAGVEIPSGARASLCRAFVRRIQRNDRARLDWPWA